MKRDWDLLRDQLIAIEEDCNPLKELPDEPKWEHQTESEYKSEMDAYIAVEAKLCGHMELLIENGYVDGMVVGRTLSGSFYYSANSPRLTMAGHDLLDTMRSSGIWETIKSKAKSSGIELTFDAIKALGRYALNQLLA